MNTWIKEPTWEELKFAKGSITLEPRPHYCDRGNFIAKVHIHLEHQIEVGVDDQDGWPRYYFDETRAKAEIEAWVKKRRLA